MRRMAGPGEWRCAAADLPPGRTLKLRVAGRGRPVDAFLVNHHGTVRAFVNRCPHRGTPLDLWPNEFYTEDGDALVCATHGARFDPLTGACVAGPCAGDALVSLPVRREQDALVVGPPE
ncbi:MAG TPA: Rieske (2Fe-2S) protein [Candidatus Tectomicrobia bacterium]|nr:Rieske (2Fe-2S) protein [Candidatus Tectomicrobia bacterium]